MLELFSLFMLLVAATFAVALLVTLGWLLKMIFKIALFPLKLVFGLILGVVGLVVALPLLVVALPVVVLAVPVIVVGALLFVVAAFCWLAVHAFAWIF